MYLQTCCFLAKFKNGYPRELSRSEVFILPGGQLGDQCFSAWSETSRKVDDEIFAIQRLHIGVANFAALSSNLVTLKIILGVFILSKATSGKSSNFSGVTFFHKKVQYRCALPL